MKKFLITIYFLLSIIVVFAYERKYNWSYHERGDLIVTAGYQNLRLQAGRYQAYSVNCEYMINDTDYDLLTVGIRGDIAFGKNYNLQFAIDPYKETLNVTRFQFDDSRSAVSLTQTMIFCNEKDNW